MSDLVPHKPVYQAPDRQISGPSPLTLTTFCSARLLSSKCPTRQAQVHPTIFVGSLAASFDTTFGAFFYLDAF